MSSIVWKIAPLRITRFRRYVSLLTGFSCGVVKFLAINLLWGRFLVVLCVLMVVYLLQHFTCVRGLFVDLPFLRGKGRFQGSSVG